MQRYLRYFLIVGGAIISILLFLLASASSNSQFFDQHYPELLMLNALIAASLLVSALAFAADAAVAGVQWLVTPKPLRGRHAEDATLVADAGEAHPSV